MSGPQAALFTLLRLTFRKIFGGGIVDWKWRYYTDKGSAKAG